MTPSPRSPQSFRPLRPFTQTLLLLSKVYERLTRRCIVVRATTMWGEPMWVALPEPASTQIFISGQMDVDLTHTLHYMLKSGQVFFDVGAHLGYFSLLARNLIGPSGQVFAFEPTPDSFSLLRRNARYNNVHVSHMAVWSERTSLTFNLYGQRFSAYNSFFAPRVLPIYQSRLRQRIIRVETISLDEFAEDRGVYPHLIKIDAESAEMQILRGARRLLSAYRPTLIVEVGDLDIPGAAGSARIVEHLRDEFNYRPFEWQQGSLVSHNVRERYDAGNLIFIPSEQCA